jgi:hypothetical protein
MRAPLAVSPPVAALGGSSLRADPPEPFLIDGMPPLAPETRRDTLQATDGSWHDCMIFTRLDPDNQGTHNACWIHATNTIRGHPSSNPRGAEQLRVFYDAVQPSWVGFGVLKHLPSAETVRVLGSLLDDERGRYIPDPARPLHWEDEMAANFMGKSNCELAVTSLAALPLVAKPVGAPSAKAFDDVPAWRQWYREIAEGRRTFRFEGDPTEYDLDGPVSAEKLVRTEALRERERDRAARAAQRQEALPAATVPAADAPPAPPPVSAPEAPPAASSPLAALLTAAGVLFAALAWFFLRCRKARLPRP